jgi:REP element-mobilizing transposase RayT
LAHTAGNLVVHLIFSTKGRHPLITPEIRTDLFAYLGGIIRKMQGTALIINGTTDHLHMLIRMRPAHAAAEIARVVKTNSSRWVREKWNMNFAWQTGYGAFSVSESNVPAVSQYIATQEEHHKKRTFQEEYVTFLKRNKIKRNKIPYDERYIWD